MKHPALMQDVLSLLSHTTHQMPLTDEQPLQSTADRIRALTARYGDRNNRILQQAVVEVLKADGVWEAAKALLQGPTSAPAEVSAFPFPGAQAAPVPQAANDNRIAQTVVTALSLRLSNALVSDLVRARHRQHRPDIDAMAAQLNASQQGMIRLSQAMPLPSAIATRQLNAWFEKCFPAMAGMVKGEDVVVCALDEEIVAQPDAAAGGVPHRRVTEEVTLKRLFWRAVAGDVQSISINRGATDIMVRTADGIRMLPALNSSEAKEMFARLLNATYADCAPASFERQLSHALHDFWDQPASFSQGHTVDVWLALEFGAQLRTEADLRMADDTLSKEMHEAVDHVLSMPDAASRNATLPEERRPGVYALVDKEEDGRGAGAPLYGSFVISEHDNDNGRGRALLWRPGEALQEFDNLKQLTAWLRQNNVTKSEASTVSVEENLFVRRVGDLRERQNVQLKDALATARETGEAWHLPEDLDVAIGIGHMIDMAPVLDEREQRRDARIYMNWLGTEPHREAKQAWHCAIIEYEKLSKQILSRPGLAEPLLALNDYGNPAVVRDYARQRLISAMNAAFNVTYDPDKIYLSLSRLASKAHEPPLCHLGVPLPVRPADIHDSPEWQTEIHSLTDWALRNVDYQTQLELRLTRPRVTDHKGEAVGLNGAQVASLVREIDLGKSYPEYLEKRLLHSSVGREAKASYVQLRQAAMRVELQNAIIREDFHPDRLQRGRKWVEAVIDRPVSQRRARVEGHAITVRQLRTGGYAAPTPVRGIYIIGVSDMRSVPSVVAYTPAAPDGRQFREAQSFQAMMQMLTDSQEMQHYLKERIGPESEQEAFGEGARTWSIEAIKGDFLEAEYEGAVRFSMDRAKSLATSTQVADRAATRDTLNNIGRFILSSAHPVIAVPFQLYQAGINVGKGIEAARQGANDEAILHFVEGIDNAFGVFLDFPTPGAVRFRPPQRLPGGRIGYPMSPVGSPGIPDAALRALQLDGFDGRGLNNLGNGLYQDVDGAQQYLQISGQYYKSAISASGKREIYAPDDTSYRREVTLQDGEWKVQAPIRASADGAGASQLRHPNPTKTIPATRLVEELTGVPLERAPPKIVSDSTLIRMKASFDAVYEAKKLLPYGSADQVTDLYGTDGEAWMRLKLNTKRFIKIPKTGYQEMVNRVQLVKWTEAGNCGEFGQVTFVELSRNPVLEDAWILLAKDNVDHAFVLVTDLPGIPADRAATLTREDVLQSMSAGNAVVADAWPEVPLIHTYEDGLFELSEVLWARPPGVTLPQPSPSTPGNEVKVGTISPGELMERIKERGRDRGVEGAGVGLIRMGTSDGFNQRRYRQVTSTNAARTYQASAGRAFDSDIVPEDFSQARKLRFAHAMKMMGEMGVNNPLAALRR